MKTWCYIDLYLYCFPPHTHTYSNHIDFVNTSERVFDLIWWIQKHVDVRVHVDFQILGFVLPPGSLWKNSGLPVKHLTLSCCLPLVCRYKETAAPSSSFSRVTIVMRVRKALNVGLDLNYFAVDTLEGAEQRRVNQAKEWKPTVTSKTHLGFLFKWDWVRGYREVRVVCIDNPLTTNERLTFLTSVLHNSPADPFIIFSVFVFLKRQTSLNIWVENGWNIGCCCFHVSILLDALPLATITPVFVCQRSSCSEDKGRNGNTNPLVLGEPYITLSFWVAVLSLPS